MKTKKITIKDKKYIWSGKTRPTKTVWTDTSPETRMRAVEQTLNTHLKWHGEHNPTNTKEELVKMLLNWAAIDYEDSADKLADSILALLVK